MTFTRFVEVGRVVLINYGPDAGKLATVIDVVDSKRVLIDGPQSITGVHRQVIGFKRISLTDIVVDKLPHNSSQKHLEGFWKAQNILGKWNSTAWAKKIESKKRRANTTDFARFKVMIAKKQKSQIVAKKFEEFSHLDRSAIFGKKKAPEPVAAPAPTPAPAKKATSDY